MVRCSTTGQNKVAAGPVNHATNTHPPNHLSLHLSTHPPTHLSIHSPYTRVDVRCVQQQRARRKTVECLLHDRVEHQRAKNLATAGIATSPQPHTHDRSTHPTSHHVEQYSSSTCSSSCRLRAIKVFVLEFPSCYDPPPERGPATVPFDPLRSPNLALMGPVLLPTTPWA